MSDRTLTCRDCGKAFVFTAGEQVFYQERDYTEPQRCASCRQARKSQRDGGGSEGRSFSSGSYSSDGGRAYGSGGGYSSGPRQMYAAVCSTCSKDTEVPFQPRNDKPVYCRECFQDHRPASPRPSYGRS